MCSRFTLTLLLCQANLLHALQLAGCGESGVVEVRENSSSLTLTCSQYTGTVTWAYAKRNTSTSTQEIGTCNTSCFIFGTEFDGILNLTLNNHTSSSLMLKYTRKDLGAPIFTCSSSNLARNCIVDIVVPAELSPVTVNYTGPNGDWNLHAGSTVSTVYSSLGRYRCLWYRSGTGPVTEFNGTLTLTPDPNNASNTENRNGSCSLPPMAFPSDIMTLSYRVVVSPGNTSKDVSIQIARPSNLTVECQPSGHVPENTDVTCTCMADSLGQPPGRLQWVRGSVNSSGNYNDRLLMTSLNMTRNEGDVQLQCDVDWATRITGPVRNVTVSYGPDNVTIPENRLFYTDTRGSRNLTLTCQSPSVKPTAGLVYTWTGRCAVFISSTCTFQPRPPGSSGDSDVNSVLETCTVRNPSNNNRTAQASFQLELKYPPLTAPQIINYSEDQVLYQEDTLTLTCTVTGGVPSVTSVNLTCDGHPSNVTAGQSSSVRILSLNTSDHEGMCVCSGQWAVPAFYTLTDNRTLTVYYPPSKPVITRTDTLPFPYLQGTTASLSCDVVSKGNPVGQLTWSGYRNGQTSNATLVMTSLDRRDNNKTVTCRAANNFTESKGRQVTSMYIVKVFYRPLITMYATGNSCQLETTSEQRRCVVTQGQRVHVTCSADSNPPPNTTVWRKYSNGLDTSTGPDLVIAKANHSADNGVYNCTVTTGNLGNSRQPPTLSSTDQLTLLVKYGPAQPVMTLNNTEGNLTVREQDLVVLTCLTDGRPIPDMALKKTGAGQVAVLAGGDLEVDERKSWLNHTLEKLQCRDAGIYTCTATNDMGTQATNVTLFVNCKPRAAEQDPGNLPSVNFVNQTVHLSLHLTAYPVPHNFSFYYLGPADKKNSSGEAVVDNSLQMSCWATDVVYNVTCNVTVDHIASADRAGHYTVTVVNDHGYVEMGFIITFKDSTNTPGRPEPWAAVGGGIAGAAVVIVVAVFVVVFIRRQRQGSNQAGKRSSLRKMDGRTHREPDDETMIVNNLYGTAEGTDARENQIRYPQRSDYEDVGLPHAAKPHVQPKPQLAAKMSTANDEKDSYSVDYKRSKLVSNPADTVEYASVDKSKTAIVSGQNGQAAARTGTTAKNKSEAIQKPIKKPKPTKDRYKGKAQKDTKEGAVYGNMPLSMNPINSKVYENFGFQNEESETKPRDPPKMPATDHRNANEDGLVYTTIQFTESQQKEAEHTPSKRETTEYVSIVFNKQPSSVSGD